MTYQQELVTIIPTATVVNLGDPPTQLITYTQYSASSSDLIVHYRPIPPQEQPKERKPMQLTYKTLDTIPKMSDVIAEEDQKKLEAAYSALGEQKKVIDVGETIALGLTCQVGMTFATMQVPKLALCRPNWAKVQIGDDSRYFHNGRERINLDIKRHVGHSRNSRGWYNTIGEDVVATRTPLIPSGLSPEKDDLILFEAEWFPEKEVKRVPTDPALLRPIAGRLYEVIAVWELSELEQAALAERL